MWNTNSSTTIRRKTVFKKPSPTTQPPRPMFHVKQPNRPKTSKTYSLTKKTWSNLYIHPNIILWSQLPHIHPHPCSTWNTKQLQKTPPTHHVSRETWKLIQCFHTWLASRSKKDQTGWIFFLLFHLLLQMSFPTEWIDFIPSTLMRRKARNNVSHETLVPSPWVDQLGNHPFHRAAYSNTKRPHQQKKNPHPTYPLIITIEPHTISNHKNRWEMFHVKPLPPSAPTKRFTWNTTSRQPINERQYIPIVIPLRLNYLTAFHVKPWSLFSAPHTWLASGSKEDQTSWHTFSDSSPTDIDSFS